MSYTTPVYAALFSLFFVGLSIRTILLRRRMGVAIGPGDEPVLTRAVRAHGNFAEYVPISLLLLFLLEVQTNTKGFIHLLGLALLIGRALHAYGVSDIAEDFRFRVAGMAITFTVIICSAVLIFAAYSPRLTSV